MSYAEHVRVLLLEEYVKAQSRNPAFSMRAYARKIGVSQSTVSEILAGKRTVTVKCAKRILHGLAVDPGQGSKILGGSESVRAGEFVPLDMDVFHSIADWHYFAILNLVNTEDFKGEIAWIAKRLNLPEGKVSEAVMALERLGLLARDGENKICSTGKQFEAISPVAQPALRRANRQNLEIAAVALEEVPLEMRDFTAITLCLDPERMDDARKMIRNFRRNFNRVMESGRRKEVYKLCVQLFPLSVSEKQMRLE